jgi:SM-20-related protein
MDAGAEEPAEVLDGGIERQDNVRRASNIEVSADLLDIVERRLDAIRGTVGDFFGLALGEREGSSFLRYREGGFYKPHRDRGSVAEWPGAARRQVAIVVFLNSSHASGRQGDFTGGTLRVYMDNAPIDVHPLRGLLVAFPADVLHQVTVVTGGTRDTIVDWFY